MNQQRFFIQLFFLSILLSILIFSLNYIPDFAVHELFSWGALLLFVLLTVLMFFVGKKSALDQNKNKFTNIVFGFTFVKLALAATVIIAYYLIAKPENKLFIIPFFIIYFTFTAYETYLMMRLGKENN